MLYDQKHGQQVLMVGPHPAEPDWAEVGQALATVGTQHASGGPIDDVKVLFLGGTDHALWHAARLWSLGVIVSAMEDGEEVIVPPPEPNGEVVAPAPERDGEELPAEPVLTASQAEPTSWPSFQELQEGLPPRTRGDRLALWSLGLAIASFCCGFLTSIPAIYLGVSALQDGVSPERRRIAYGGIALGSLMLSSTCLSWVFLALTD